MQSCKLPKAILGVLMIVFFCHIALYSLKTALPAKSAFEEITRADKSGTVLIEPSPKPLSSLEQSLALFAADRTNTYAIYVKPLDSDLSLIIHNEQMTAASMIKLFIMAEAFRQKKAGLIDLDEESTITDDVKVGGAGILQNVPVGTRKTLRELIDLMIIESDNTATNIIIDRLTIENINQLITGLGLKNTVLQRKMMDFQSKKNGKENYTSAFDFGMTLEKIYWGQCIGPQEDAAMLEILLRQKDNDKIPALLPATIKVAHKTGELTGILHDGGIVYGEKGAYIVCIMTNTNKDVATASKDIAAISKTIYQFLNEK